MRLPRHYRWAAGVTALVVVAILVWWPVHRLARTIAAVVLGVVGLMLLIGPGKPR